MNGTDFKDFKVELLKDKNVRAAYEALNPKYEIIEAILARRNEMSMSQRKLARLVGNAATGNLSAGKGRQKYNN